MTERVDLSGLGFLLHDAARLFRRRFEQKAQHHGLTSAQWRLLARLSRQEGLNQASLAALLEVEPITLCRLVDRMEAGGWVERVADPDDRRAKLVRMTDKSRALVGKMRGIALEVYEEALAGFSEAERAALIGSMKKIVEALSQRTSDDETRPVAV
jgi:MarR family transcriptional regulator, transcriptional regulator for hemolysin